MPLLLAALAGLAASLAFPPAELWPIAWIALVPWLAALSSSSFARAAASGAIVTASLVLGMSLWVPGVVMESFGGSIVGALGLWILVIGAAAPGGAVVGVLLRLLPFDSALFPLWAGSAWAAYELSLARIFPELPWLVLGATQIDTVVAPAAAVLGVHGVSAAVVAANALVAQAMRRVSPRAISAGLALTLVPLIGSIAWGQPLLDPQPGAETLRVAIVQPSSPLGPRENATLREEKLATLLDLTREGGDADLILWPESALSFSPSGRPDVVQRIQEIVDQKGAPLLLGAPGQATDSRSIAVHRIEPGRHGSDVVYEKHLLVPFAEAIPSWFPRSLRRSLGRITPSWPIRRGRDSPGVEVAGAKLELSICFEAAFSGLVANPDTELLVNLVNDGWYDSTPAARQHFQLSRWRSLERGAWMARAAYSGTSAWVAPTGETPRTLPIGTRSVQVQRIPRLAVSTPFESWTYAWLPGVLLAVAVPFSLQRSRHVLARWGKRGSRALL